MVITTCRAQPVQGLMAEIRLEPVRAAPVCTYTNISAPRQVQIDVEQQDKDQITL